MAKTFFLIFHKSLSPFSPALTISRQITLVTAIIEIATYECHLIRRDSQQMLGHIFIFLFSIAITPRLHIAHTYRHMSIIFGVLYDNINDKSIYNNIRMCVSTVGWFAHSVSITHTSHTLLEPHSTLLVLWLWSGVSFDSQPNISIQSIEGEN